MHKTKHRHTVTKVEQISTKIHTLDMTSAEKKRKGKEKPNSKEKKIERGRGDGTDAPIKQLPSTPASIPFLTIYNVAE